ncbi:hypothetical protein [Gymnodinialimonas ulvae]|uniref:hypothetical protein n=1 Tax=Gymnodinialimonas ulvae TaxID=3126504 RepID=UPI0030B7E014
MNRTYRIDGAGDEKAFRDASRMADNALVDLFGVGGSTNILWALSMLLAGAGATAAVFLILQTSGSTFPGLQGQGGLLVAVPVGVGLFLAAITLLGRWIDKATARGFLNDPMMQNHHVLLSEGGMRVVSGRCYTQFHWADVTRIEVAANVIFVMAGVTWAYIRLAGFADEEAAKSAIADMRAWQKAARS